MGWRMAPALAGALLVVVAMAIPRPAPAASRLESRLQALNLPEGFRISVYARVPRARSLAMDPATGVIIVGTRGSNVYGVSPPGSGSPRVVRILSGLHVPNGVAIRQGWLYIAEQSRVVRYRIPEQPLAGPWSGRPEVLYDRLPDLGHHGWRYAAFGPDGDLYVTVGSPCNICQDEGIEGTIIRLSPDDGHISVFATGIRNSVGMAFQPGTGVLYFTDNGADGMGDDVPPDELNAAPRSGLFFGFPYYGGGHARSPGWEERQPPKAVTFPVVEFQAHTANLGILFYTGDQFPASYRGDALVAQHGSWNRSRKVGYRLMRIRFGEQGRILGHQVFIDGWLRKDESVWGRPVDLLQLPDGSLLVSDDYAGALYRVWYAGP